MSWTADPQKRELLRAAAKHALSKSNGGHTLSPEARAWARYWASIKPLGGKPTGETNGV